MAKAKNLGHLMGKLTEAGAANFAALMKELGPSAAAKFLGGIEAMSPTQLDELSSALNNTKSDFVKGVVSYSNWKAKEPFENLKTTATVGAGCLVGFLAAAAVAWGAAALMGYPDSPLPGILGCATGVVAFAGTCLLLLIWPFRLKGRCPFCKARLRSLTAKQCFTCGRDWHQMERGAIVQISAEQTAEPAHAPAPAAGSVTNGKSSPPAR